MDLDIPGEPVLEVPVLWGDSVKVNLNKVEIGDSLQDGKTRGFIPRVVCVLSINKDHTLTVMGTDPYEVRNAKGDGSA